MSSVLITYTVQNLEKSAYSTYTYTVHCCTIYYSYHRNLYLCVLLIFIIKEQYILLGVEKLTIQYMSFNPYKIYLAVYYQKQ